LASRPVAEVVARGTFLAALPNLLTLLRIGLVPVLVVVLLYPTPAARAGAAACFLLACVTDFLDGWLARRHGITTALGQLLDPLADKLLVTAALIMLAAVPPEPRVPVWMVVVIVCRELAVTGLRGLASSSGVVVPAQELGKYKMIAQMFALEGLLLHYRYPIPGTSMAIVVVFRELAVTGLRGIASTGGVVLAAEQLGKYKMIFQMFSLEALLIHYRYPVPGTGLIIDFHAGGMVFLWVALVLAVWSGVDYYVRILRQLRLD